MRLYSIARYLSLAIVMVSMIGHPAFACVFGDESDSADTKLKIRKLIIAAGTTEPFKALFVADSHITKAGSTENSRKLELAAQRSQYFPMAEEYLEEALQYVADNDMYFIFGGDLIDFVSEDNLKVADRIFSNPRTIACVGNHEFSQYVGEAREDAAYKAMSLDRVTAAFHRPSDIYSMVVNGINFVSVDDVYYNFTESQFRQMKKEFAKGYPVVLLCHVPLYTPINHDILMESCNGIGGYMIGAPRSITDTYFTDPSLPDSENWRNVSYTMRADKTTRRVMTWLKKQSQLKAVLCGHCHEFFAEQFSPTAMQYTVGACYHGDAYEIEFY